MLKNPSISQSAFKRAPHHDPQRRLCLGASLRLSLIACLAGSAALVDACSSNPKDRTTPATLTLVAGAKMNPDARGRSSPMEVRIYSLTSTNAFETADFFSIHDNESATLGATLLQREDVQLLPGAKKELKLDIKGAATAIGVIGAFRDIDHAHWREVRAINTRKAIRLEIHFEALSIGIAPP